MKLPITNIGVFIDSPKPPLGGIQLFCVDPNVLKRMISSLGSSDLPFIPVKYAACVGCGRQCSYGCSSSCKGTCAMGCKGGCMMGKKGMR